MSGYYLGPPSPDDLEAYDPVGGNRVAAVVVLCLLLVLAWAAWQAWPVLCWGWQWLCSGAVAL